MIRGSTVIQSYSPCDSMADMVVNWGNCQNQFIYNLTELESECLGGHGGENIMLVCVLISWVSSPWICGGVPLQSIACTVVITPGNKSIPNQYSITKFNDSIINLHY